MAPRSQPHRISWPFTPQTASDLDELIQILFDDVRNDSIFPTTTEGDLLYRDDEALTRLGIGAANTVLRTDGVIPEWDKVGLTTDVTGTLPVTSGGTGTATAFTAGSVVFAGASGVYAQDNTNFFWDDTLDQLRLDNTLLGKWGPVNTYAFFGNSAIDQTNAGNYGLLQSSVGATFVNAASGQRINLLVNNVSTMRVSNIGVGIGIDPTVALEVNSGAYPVTRIIRTTGGAVGPALGTLACQHRTTVDMVDGFGSAFVFEIRDSAAVDNPIGSIGAIRAGADNTGNLVFSRAIAGTITEVIRVSDNLAIGTTTFPSTGTKGLIFGDGTALATMGSNTAGLYADDVSGTVEMFAINETGTVTQLTGVGALYSAAKVMQRVVLGI